MNHRKNEELFSISQAAKACGSSRSSLMRLEDAGYLNPAKIEASTGFRYYDCRNVSQISRYFMWRELGLDKSDIIDYTFGNVSTDEMISAFQVRMQLLSRCMEELFARTKKTPAFSFLESPTLTVYSDNNYVEDAKETEIFIHNVSHAAISLGFRALHMEPLFYTREDTGKLHAGMRDISHEIKVCIPIAAKSGKNNPHVEVLPACTLFCILYTGDDICEGWELLWDEIRKRELTPSGSARVLSLIAPYADQTPESAPLPVRLAVPVIRPA